MITALPDGNAEIPPGYKQNFTSSDERDIPDIFNLQVEDQNHKDPLIFCIVDTDFPLYTGIGFELR
jgi:hypothetical protein